MKKLDWIIAATLLLILALGAFYYFFGYKKGRTVAEIFKGSGGSSSGASSGSSGSNSGTSSGSGSQALPYGALPLKRGDKNQLVVKMQRALNFLGADLIVDGNFGPKTEAALEDELGTKVLDLQKAAALYVKVQNWAYAQSPVNTAILAELRALTGQ
jgi:hypothetical protein